MRIWYQSFLVASDVAEYMDAIRGRIKSLVRPDTEVVMHGFAEGTFRDAYPGPEISSAFLYNLHTTQFALAGMEAERQGFDAVVIAPISAPMISETRSLVGIPVVGYGDTAFRMAGMYGRRFGIIFFNLGRADFWPSRVAEWGLTSSFAGVMPAGITFADVMNSYRDESVKKSVIERVQASCRRMIEERGVDVIIPGEMPLNVMLGGAGLSRVDDVPLLDGLAMTLKSAEMLVELKRQCGLYQSHRGFFNAKPDPSLVEYALKFYGMDRLKDCFPALPQ